MADYTKVYDGAAKDVAESTITGADFDVEFNAIETAIGTKADKDVPVATNSIGLLDVNGNLLSSEVLISTDGTLVDNSDAAVPTEKAVKTYADAVEASANAYTDAAIGSLTRTVVEIGNWNMDSTISVNVTHGLTVTDIRGCRILIRDDNGTLLYDFERHSTAETASEGHYSISTTQIQLARRTGGLFDGVSFDGTGFTRGWIIFDHV